MKLMAALPSVVLLGPGADGFEGPGSSAGLAWLATHPTARVLRVWPAETWPFTYPFEVALPNEPAIIVAPDLHQAFVNNQIAGTRLVTTQPGYLAQAWLTALRGRDVLLIGQADPESLESYGQGAFPPTTFLVEGSGYEIPSVRHDTRQCAVPGQLSDEAVELLVAAIRAVDPAERLAQCVRALEHGRVAPALVATASACMEVNDLAAAARDLDEALQQAPEWGAAHFERGKLWLRVDDLERASVSFRAAADRLPNFASAWANLGAALGEIGRTTEALEAFQEALRCEPSNQQALNNVGVANRDLGNLAESEAAFRRVIERVPHLAFGYYNLGHALFLQGRYQAALSAYVEGQRRDPERNAVQASRLALCRLAVGDGSGAIRELQRATNGLPHDYRQQLLADTNSVAWALLTHRPELPGWKQVNDWLSAELARQV
jgi:tetratricopeptide (TPR) repeat protein